jgi:hypothetical protein
MNRSEMKQIFFRFGALSIGITEQLQACQAGRRNSYTLRRIREAGEVIAEVLANQDHSLRLPFSLLAILQANASGQVLEQPHLLTRLLLEELQLCLRVAGSIDGLDTAEWQAETRHVLAILREAHLLACQQLLLLKVLGEAPERQAQAGVD